MMPSAPLPPTFSFKQVEAALASVLDVADEKRATFASRLSQLQKLGLPWDANSGRGVKVAYSLRQIAEMLFYFDLLDAGVSPNIIVTHFRDSPVFRGSKAWRETVLASAKPQSGLWMTLTINALAYLRDSDAARVGPSLREQIWTLSITDSAPLNPVATATARPMIVINLAARVRVLLRACNVDPSTLATED